MNSNGSTHKSAYNKRDQLQKAQRIVVKIGSAVLTRQDTSDFALGRFAFIVEQVSDLIRSGKDVIIVTSGAVALGKQKIQTEIALSRSIRQTMRQTSTELNCNNNKSSAVVRAAAAIGQSNLVAAYSDMFDKYNVKTAQVLVTKSDFHNPISRINLKFTIEDLLGLNIIPIINTNDVIVSPMMPDHPEIIIEPETGPKEQTTMVHDNDSLGALIAVEMNADLFIILSDVDGVYTAPPGQEGSKLINNYSTIDSDPITFGNTNKVGTGGMKSKVDAASWALARGVSTVICNGSDTNAIRNIVNGFNVGTFFTNTLEKILPVEVVASRARQAGEKLASLKPEERAEILETLANLLIEKKTEILTANGKDLKLAQEVGLAPVLLSRLKLSDSKLNSLSDGLKLIAKKSKDTLNRVLIENIVADNLILKQVTVPIGNILVIFESRPDCLPQIAGLSIATGNGLILKGGKEAYNSNQFLWKIVQQALSKFKVENAVGLVNTREEIGDLIKLKHYIDLIIPRGSYDLVRNIERNANGIPVLGHSEGICHVYVDKDADLKKAVEIVIDSKCDYPSACNAMETLLIHSSFVRSEFFDQLCNKLKAQGVKVHPGPKLFTTLPIATKVVDSLKKEYGCLECTIELVDGVEEAIKHINTYGSGHTDVIITENAQTASLFTSKVNSACCFHNCSSRFADGYRFGLGAEVGISTGKIHATGPVGMEGLLSKKWILTGNGQTVQKFTEGLCHYKHIPVQSNHSVTP